MLNYIYNQIYYNTFSRLRDLNSRAKERERKAKGGICYLVPRPVQPWLII